MNVVCVYVSVCVYVLYACLKWIRFFSSFPFPVGATAATAVAVAVAGGGPRTWFSGTDKKNNVALNRLSTS
jgi:hypothetical protein